MKTTITHEKSALHPNRVEMAIPVKPALNGAYVADYSANPTAEGNEGLVPLIPPQPHDTNAARHTPPLRAPSPSAPAGGKRFPVGLVSVVALLAIGAGAYYFFSPKHEPTAAAPATPPPVPATVQTVAPQQVRIWNEFSGRLQAVDYAQIRPEVSGRITEVRFEDGQTVNAGDILFVIDPRPYEDAVAKAKARVASAKASIEFTKAEQKRAEILIRANAIAQRDFDQSASSDRVAVSNLDEAEAALKQASLDLEHAYVKAPISGRASRAEITVGNVVQSGPGAPVLTSIASRDGIYADFEVDEQTYLETIRNAATGNAQERLIPVQLILAGDKDHVYDGTIWSFDNRIDAASGTIRARAKFANTDGALLPGMFVTVKLASSRERSAVLIPERAIGSDQSKKFVYVIDSGNKATYREIQLGKSIREQRVIESGLLAGDRVVVDGVQHVRPGAVVQPTEIQPAVVPVKITSVESARQ